MSRQVDRPPVPRDTPFASEVETLVPWVRPTVLALLSGLRPEEVARELRVSSNYVQCARHVAVKMLGPSSPLVAALPRREIIRRPSKPKALVNFVEPTSVSLRTSAAPDGHWHIATFDDCGRGRTDEVNGHSHRILELDVIDQAGHAHELTAVRA